MCICVLILILLEYGLRQWVYVHNDTPRSVLILILLEYGLRRLVRVRNRFLLFIVLILILLEYGLRLLHYGEHQVHSIGLNPYSIGIWSATRLQKAIKKQCICLNPYSIGIWSATWKG